MPYQFHKVAPIKTTTTCRSPPQTAVPMVDAPLATTKDAKVLLQGEIKRRLAAIDAKEKRMRVAGGGASAGASLNPAVYNECINPAEVYFKQVRSKIGLFRSSPPQATMTVALSTTPKSATRKRMTMLEAYSSGPLARGAVLAAKERLGTWHRDPLRPVPAASAEWVDRRESVFSGPTPRFVLLREQAARRSSSVEVRAHSNRGRTCERGVAPSTQRSASALARIPEPSERIKHLATPNAAARLVSDRQQAQSRNAAGTPRHATSHPTGGLPLPQRRTDWRQPEEQVNEAEAAPVPLTKYSVESIAGPQTPQGADDSPYHAISPLSEAKDVAPLRNHADATPVALQLDPPSRPQARVMPLSVEIPTPRVVRADLFQGHRTNDQNEGVDAATRRLLVQLSRRT